MMFKSLLLAALIAMAGCATGDQTPPPKAGSVSIERTTAKDGTKTERITYTTPELADGPGSVTLGDFNATFAKGRDPVFHQAKDVWPQRMMYGVGVACILLGAAFVGIGKHFKLGGISALCGVGILALAQFMEKFGTQIALFTGIGILLSGLFVGWFLWQDYKADGKIDGKLKLKT